MVSYQDILLASPLVNNMPLKFGKAAKTKAGFSSSIKKGMSAGKPDISKQYPNEAPKASFKTIKKKGLGSTRKG
jgi:hypothetical protein